MAQCPKPGGKHKRGTLGSTEEEASAPKRINMAASKDSDDIASEDVSDDENDSTDQPTRAELKAMLVDIQISISSILRENKETRKELAELKKTVRDQNTEVTSLKTTLVSIQRQCADKEKELAAAKNHIDEQKEEITELYELQDQLEQYTRKNSLEIHGISESAYNSTEEVVLKLAEALEVPVLPQEIEIPGVAQNSQSEAVNKKIPVGVGLVFCRFFLVTTLNETLNEAYLK